MNWEEGPNGWETVECEKKCGSCKYWEPYKPNRCINPESEYYECRMQPEEKCGEWEEWVC